MPQIRDVAPDDDEVTSYDRLIAPIYLRILDAERSGADWREVTEVVLKIPLQTDPERARRAYESHLARARWMMESGYRGLLSHSARRGLRMRIDSTSTAPKG